jgi:DNA-binding CsgD family transcriptional regulator
MLRGRASECAMLERLLDAARAGHSAGYVLRGEAGVGKSALLDFAAARSEGCRVLRAAGVESEMELPFASLHQLCAPLLDGLAGLPAPQRDALGTAFGLHSGPRPDRFLVGLASLSLLSAAAEPQPLVCLIDDAQWLDRSSVQALAFTARRLRADSVVLLFAERDPEEVAELEALPALRLRGLADSDARELLASAIPGTIDARVRERIIAETHGNPLALLELPRGSSSASLAGGFGLPGGLPLSRRIEASFRRQVGQLPVATQRLLLVAAAEPLGDPALLWRAAGHLGIAVEAAGPAEAAGLLEAGSRITFRHPLLRSGIYRAASPEERRNAHCALAEATDPELDPDRRAWHRAQATLGPDETVADELERSADRAAARGGMPAAAAFLERSAALTLDPVPRADRALAAAQVKHHAGAFDAALELLATAEAGPLTEIGHARAGLLRGQITFGLGSPDAAVRLLLEAAKRLEPLDSALARETYRDAFFAALVAGRLQRDGGIHEVAIATRSAPPPAGPARASDRLLQGLAVLITEGHGAGAPLLREALRALRREELPTTEALLWLPLACRMAHEVWDDESWDVLSNLLVDLARDAGALAVLQIGLLMQLANRLFAGELAVAATLAEEVAMVSEATGGNRGPYGAVVVAAFRGYEDAMSRVIDAAMKEMLAQGEGQWLTARYWTEAVVKNSRGRFEQALVAAEQARDYPLELGLSTWALVELIEAAALSGKTARAAEAVQQLAAMTRASGTDWALGIEARSRALVAQDDSAESLYREAIDRLDRTRMRLELARAHLLYGEWLRRENRRIDAREQLRTANEMFASMGANGFAERAARSLLATGEKARKRTADTRDELTAQEVQIAELARQGRSNPEIGAQLFISPRTVEYHLHKVFTKLAITSRVQLDGALSANERDREAQPAQISTSNAGVNVAARPG